EVAKACGCRNVVECSAEETAAELERAISSEKMTIIISKCQPGNVNVSVIDDDPVNIANRFSNQIRELNS
ncbi:MAG: sulfopyruvate decarboxylase subunit beta, partial [Rhodobacteraceae bacterium]|nr:sulfopyruvate decarboxylase subunit beta [Paracoccaceae bacterium]